MKVLQKTNLPIYVTLIVYCLNSTAVYIITAVMTATVSLDTKAYLLTKLRIC